jgi:hypothetical protein
MFSLRNRTIKRLKKRAEKVIASWTERHGREPTMADIRSLPALGVLERIAFTLVGAIFLWISFLWISEEAWTIPFFILPIAGYVTIRGIVGHELNVRGKNPTDIATPEGIVTSAENELTSTGRKLLVLDMCFAILLIIVEVVSAVIGSLASALG